LRRASRRLGSRAIPRPQCSRSTKPARAKRVEVRVALRAAAQDRVCAARIRAKVCVATTETAAVRARVSASASIQASGSPVSGSSSTTAARCVGKAAGGVGWDRDDELGAQRGFAVARPRPASRRTKRRPAS